MTHEELAERRLIDSAVPAEEVLIAAETSPEERSQTRCAICGTSPDNASDLPISYSNPVCKECDALAVNESGGIPWEGYPPGERPESEPGVIHLEPDHGQNPVYIAGVKCWRRYRFGGWITRRDAFDCESLEEFQERHRIDGGPIHAFNVPQPDGVALVDEQCEELIARYDSLISLRESFEDLLDQSPTWAALEPLVETATEFDIHPTPDSLTLEEMDPQAVAEMFTDELQTLTEMRFEPADEYFWASQARFCKRYRKEA